MRRPRRDDSNRFDISVVMFNRTVNHDWPIIVTLLSGLAFYYLWICEKAVRKITS